MEIKTGSVILSLAGHDKGRLMLVVGADGDRISVADGKERKLASPKKKNAKHIRRTSYSINSIELEGLTDKKLRKTLNALSRNPQSTLQESE